MYKDLDYYQFSMMRPGRNSERGGQRAPISKGFQCCVLELQLYIESTGELFKVFCRGE